MAKGIIFDLGEVYFQIDWEAIDGEMKQKFGISSLIRSNYGEDINKIYDKSSVGELSLKDVFEKICEDQNLDAGEVTAYYKELYKKFKKVNLDVADLIKKLKGNVKVACFTDTNDVHLQTHREQNHLDDFDYVFASCELGKVKKEEGAFDKMLQEMNLEPNEVILVDDSEKNIESARKRGMKGIVYKDYDQLVEELNKLGVDV